MADSAVAITPGAGASIDTYQIANGDHRQVIILGDHSGFGGRSATQRTIGRAGTASQNLMTLWNASGSGLLVEIKFVAADLMQTVVKAITTPPPLVRLQKLTTAPTGGTAGYKISDYTNGPASNANVTLLQDAATDTTLSSTALTITQTTAANTLTQEWAPRWITAAGYEPEDRIEFLSNGTVTLIPGEGIALRLDYSNANSNPATDIWASIIVWEEFIA